MYFNQIDTFRFFAVFLVLVSHWLNDVEVIERLHLGAMGVEFFFVVSGFLISLQLYRYKEAVEEKKVSVGKALKTFFIRRVLRIFPLYYFILIIATIFNDGAIREAFWWNFTYTTNFYCINYEIWPALFAHFWSLSVEEHFYLFWPTVLLFTKRKNYPAAFIIIALIALSFRLYYYSTLGGFYFYTYAHTIACLDLFMFGGGLAFLYRYRKDWFERLFGPGLKRYLVPLLFFGLMGFWMVYEIESFNAVFRRFLLAFFYAFAIGVLVLGVKGFFGKIYNNKVLVYLGKLSYGIYLIHNFVPGLLYELRRFELNELTVFIINFIVTVLLSMLLHRFIEEPVRRLNRHFKLE